MRKIAATFFLTACAFSARADFIDFYNGVSLGAAMPKSDMVFLGPAPALDGKLQLIDFWATWCEPCRDSIPKLNALHRAYSGKGLVIIGVTKEGREPLAPFLQKNPVKYALALDGEKKLYTALGIRGLPYAIFVNRAGTIVWRGQPAAISEQLVESLLAKDGG
ncbi:MAG: TlpA family protein disulfide reductase [Burkholderiales bacterium]|nr:TlpA family protein disulfide reductase [Burkholderiales bacterium]